MKNQPIRRPSHRLAAGFVLALGLALPSAALGSEEFPTELTEVADCTPTCTTCHTTDPGQAGSADKPFAVVMQENGLVQGDPDTVLPAFALIDPDGDGKFLDADGNEVEIKFECQAEVDYGCSVDPKPKQGGSTGFWTPLLLSALGLGVFARRRQHS